MSENITKIKIFCKSEPLSLYDYIVNCYIVNTTFVHKLVVSKNFDMIKKLILRILKYDAKLR